MPLEKRAGGVRPVDLEALVVGAVALEQAKVVEHRTDVEELGVVVEAELLGLQGVVIPYLTRTFAGWLSSA
jgi:hypothetical protein